MLSHLSTHDLDQLNAKGIPPQEIERQLTHFKRGFPFLPLVRAATLGDGIIQLDAEKQAEAIEQYERALPHKEVIKFVPASGAASRMFKDLFAFMESYTGTPQQVAELQADTGKQAMRTFFERIRDFAFQKDLALALPEGRSLDGCVKDHDYGVVLKALLTDEGLGYGELPKGLLSFHRYSDGQRTPVEEHMVEGANYCMDRGGTVRLHFTVSPEHQARFEAHVAAVRPEYEARFGCQFEISYSIQKPSTDTLAVDLDNQPFRLEDGSILFRPGGHGALLENLNELEADLLFIKNVDNVVPDRLKGETYRYKKALAGVLLSYQEKIFDYLKALEAGPTPELLAEIRQFLRESLCVEFDLPATESEQVAFLTQKLNRPLRVCGMVKNEGEPGGGPYWVKNNDGSTSLQIVESAQIDQGNPEQLALMKGATHFNPVDLVCATRDRHGKSFDLLEFRDPQTGFISHKSKDGRELKAQELPGLWNGSMADWNTLFVEVPISTFNPVKTVFDLLRPQHQ